MRVLITGICGFVGSSLARRLPCYIEGIEIFGIDNLGRPGSESNRSCLRAAGIRLFHGDLRVSSDLASLPAADWVVDAAANPSVLAGLVGKASTRQLMEHNLIGSLNVLEYCRGCTAGLTLLSTSRVYSVAQLAGLPLLPAGEAFTLDCAQELPSGVTAAGIAESFPVSSPISLYGSTKLASEIVAQEYGAVFGFPVWVNRCGVVAGAGQFGTAEQGIFSYWLHAHAARRTLRYIGFGGLGLQVRDGLHPDDLASLLHIQMKRGSAPGPRLFNIGGGCPNSLSLAQLTAWCDDRFGPHSPTPDARPRPFDVPWLVMDSTLARQELNWKPSRSIQSILEEIADHVREYPDWLERCEAV